MQKKGISLIVLVITIIVMIILAASVVISMSNTGIIDKANHAVNLSNEKQVQDLASLIWAEAYLDPAKKENIVQEVKDALEEQGITDDKWNIEVTSSGVTVTSKTNSGNQVVMQTATIYRIDSIASEYEIASTIEFEAGMTWREYINSNYNTNCRIIDEYACYGSVTIEYTDDMADIEACLSMFTIVNLDDVINPNYYYALVHRSMGGE